MAIERAMEHKEGQDNLTWGTYVRNSVSGIAHKAETQPIFNPAVSR